jgi:Hypothetical glycosyl hydrolase family 15
MSHAPTRRPATDGARRWRQLAVGMGVLAAGLVSVGLGSDGDRRLPAGSSAMEQRLGPAAGAIRFVKHTGPDFDRFTRDVRFARWMQRRFWRMTTYSPYFDSRLRWYGNAWVYRDLYAIYRGGALARRHPEWILRDERGRRLYIPFHCSGGSCPQYAGDVGNQRFRSHWIRRARAALRRGYRGIFVDDVNMLLRVADGRGRVVAPIDPRTGSPMSLAQWRLYVSRFTAEIRAAFPRAELVHNVLWFAGDRDPAVRRQLAAADLVNIEHGVNDPGLHGGRGPYGFETLLGYIDRRQRQGAAVVLGGAARRRAGHEYALASYLLVNSGRDAISSSFGSRPGNWSRGYKTSLGAPRGRRHRWGGLLRRNFDRGLVLVNPPDAPVRARRLGRTYGDLAGRRRSSVVLPAASGIVLSELGSGR